MRSKGSRKSRTGGVRLSMCQVADGVPAYEVKDEAGNIETIHCNQLFLVATPKEAITPLGAGTSISEENIAWSTWVEHTLLEVENDSPEGSMDGADTLSPASRVPLGWGTEQQGSPLDLLVEPPNPAHIFQKPDVIRGVGAQQQ